MGAMKWRTAGALVWPVVAPVMVLSVVVLLQWSPGDTGFECLAISIATAGFVATWCIAESLPRTWRSESRLGIALAIGALQAAGALLVVVYGLFGVGAWGG
jgi:hypothetical protein